MHVFVWNSIQFVKSNNIEIRQIELNSKQKRALQTEICSLEWFDDSF